MDLYLELVELIDALQRSGIDYAVCGGIAVALHGYSRFTKDIDLLILSEDLPRVLSVAAQHGFNFDAGAISFATGTPNEMKAYRVNKVSGKEYLMLDLVLVSPILENVWKGRERYSWQDRILQVVSLSGLATMKRLANREQDRLDIKMLGFDDDIPISEA